MACMQGLIKINHNEEKKINFYADRKIIIIRKQLMRIILLIKITLIDNILDNKS